ncbi:hypothetical protein DOTSEDRAFT_71612 [Dothistroma septosporum NZE10]|uniref:Uncharacterized protein n=1 Tax=Dothistroma septosporum (strain NZE10 / CBS 128990) TaxID=675120 RepID=N1PN83_DOTSN|nr:hypothetical protein DOTSEDRAFT_71612 [Dothistroma septosporum NZE10]
MPTFAPVYSVRPSRRALPRIQNRDPKRRRGDTDKDDSEDDRLSSESDTDEELAIRGSQSVNKKDPYHVAGWPRNKPLPGANFPHAPVKSGMSTGLTIKEELAQLNPPIYVPSSHAPEGLSDSVKQRHLDNVTAILHKCMLAGDWDRASQAFGLILRTEIRGNPVDVRQNGLWLIGGELLMRRKYQAVEQQQVHSRTANHEDIETDEIAGTTAAGSIISDDGFKLARQYYERLILQYPHLQRAHHDAVNALAVYPVLFNVWIYEVHDRARRARRQMKSAQETSDHGSVSNADGSEGGEDTERKRNLLIIRRTELEQALHIVQRMDGIMVSPPYDTSTELLHQRGTMALWLSDMHRDISRAHTTSVDSSGTSSEDDSTMDLDTLEARASKKRHETQALSERNKARTIFIGLNAAGVEVSMDIMDAIEEDEDLSMNQGID